MVSRARSGFNKAWSIRGKQIRENRLLNVSSVVASSCLSCLVSMIFMLVEVQSVKSYQLHL